MSPMNFLMFVVLSSNTRSVDEDEEPDEDELDPNGLSIVIQLLLLPLPMRTLIRVMYELSPEISTTSVLWLLLDALLDPS